MNLQERSLYHQIHPAKLFTDVSTSVISLYLFWQHDIILGVIVGVAPSVLASFVIIRYASLEKYQGSALGKYLNKYMTRSMQALRLAGQVIVWYGGWYHTAWLIGAGFLVILFGWVRGKVFP
jgi:hypothetical protein